MKHLKLYESFTKSISYTSKPDITIQKDIPKDILLMKDEEILQKYGRIYDLSICLNFEYVYDFLLSHKEIPPSIKNDEITFTVNDIDIMFSNIRFPKFEIEYLKGSSNKGCDHIPYNGNKNVYMTLMEHILKNYTNFFIETFLKEYNKKDIDSDSSIHDWIKVKEYCEKSLTWQQFLLDKGYIQGLMKLKKLQPTISKQIKDIKKQTDWS